MALMQFELFAPGLAGGDEDGAKKQLAAIEKQDPARGAEAQAAFAMKAKHTDQAIALYQKALKLDPKLADAALSLGFTLEKQKDWDGAFSAFQRVIGIGGDGVAMGRYQLGKIAATTGTHIALGEAALRAYLQRDHPAALPTAAYAHWRLGMIQEKKGAPDQARSEYEAALKLDPGNKDARKALNALDKRS
jgi:tetratricopeptide (TPR) repeat protein